MNPRRFLFTGGTVLLTIGVLGLTGLLGRISPSAFFHPPGWINGLHTMVGTVDLAIASFGLARLQTTVAFTGMILLNTIGVLGLLTYLGALLSVGGAQAGAVLGDPSDHIAHLIMGALAVWAWTNRPRIGHEV